ncbi:MAG: glycosyltransferase family 4 protein [Armatimonadota bacterium]
MKILIFNAYYEPEVAASLYLSTNLYEDMANYGWDIDLFVPMPTRGVDDKTRNQYKKRKIVEKCDGKLRIHRFSMIGEGKNPLLRAARYLIINLIFIWKSLYTPTDIIFVQSTPPTQGAMGAILKRIKKVPLVYSLQDIFPDSLVNTGLTKKGSFLYNVGRVIEKFTYKNADKIIVISEDFKNNIMAKEVPEEKIEVVYNWVDERDVVAIDRKDNKLVNRFNLDETKFYISYCGNIGLTQNMDMLVEIAEELKNNTDIGFLIFGDGAYKHELERLINEKRLNNINLLPFQPYEDIAYVFSLGDVGLIISKANVGQNSVPSKTWSFMSAERAVLASFDTNSELSRIIKNTSSGLCVPAEDKIALKNAILMLYENKSMRLAMGKHGREFILNNLTREVGTSKIIDIMQKTRNHVT